MFVISEHVGCLSGLIINDVVARVGCAHSGLLGRIGLGLELVVVCMSPVVCVCRWSTWSTTYATRVRTTWRQRSTACWTLWGPASCTHLTYYSTSVTTKLSTTSSRVSWRYYTHQSRPRSITVADVTTMSLACYEEWAEWYERPFRLAFSCLYELTPAVTIL